jgi:hypothetical protein
VTLRVDARPHGLHVEGTLANDAGSVVAERSLTATSDDCSVAARAIGLWAALVLDQQTARAAAPPAGAPETDPRHTASVGGAASAGTVGLGLPPDSPDVDVSALSDAGERLTSPASPHRDPRTGAEFGASTFLLMGTGAGPVAGLSPYVLLDASRGVYLRPALALGDSISALGSSGSTSTVFMAARLDACARIPGNYTANRGLELVLCAGADAGALDGARLVPWISIGPGAELRGELPNRWSLVLRGVGGVDMVRTWLAERAGNRITPDWVSGRIELALAWRVE